MVKGADRLTVDAANAFLKTLEEPPAHTIFLLLAESPMHLLETIQSRAFEIRLRPLKGHSAEDADRFGDLLSRYGNGLWDDFLKSYHEKPREELKKTLVMLLAYLSDVLKRQSSGDPSKITDLCGWLGALDSVMEAKEALDDNANQKLALTRLGMRLEKSISLAQAVL
jgi:DNA polymerase-3 subunit delta'